MFLQSIECEARFRNLFTKAVGVLTEGLQERKFPRLRSVSTTLDPLEDAV